MTKLDKGLLIVGTILKAFVGKPTQDKYEEKANAPRPLILSRRAINGTTALITTLLSVFMGIDIPQESIDALMAAGEQLMAAGEQLIDAGKAAWPLVIALWTALMAIWGHIKRKK